MDESRAPNAVNAVNAMEPTEPMESADTVSAIGESARRRHTAYVTPEGAAWLATASAFPRSVAALWSVRPTAPTVLPCGIAFDAVSVPALFGRRLLEQLWAAGPGSGPVAVHRDRVLLLVAPGTARRLPALLAWEEWADRMPPLMCHGPGDAVTLPPPFGPPGARRGADAASRWVVAPDTRSPWLPGPGEVLWACVRAARSTSTGPENTAPVLVSAPGTA